VAAGTTRADLIALAEEKFADAALLLAHGRYSNAFYLAGYAVEIGLKACIAKRIVAEAIPNRKFINSIYTHDLADLVGVADLKDHLAAQESRSAAFSTNWALVKQWDEASRYAMMDAYGAQTMIDAIGDTNDGVLQWLRRHW